MTATDPHRTPAGHDGPRRREPRPNKSAHPLLRALLTVAVLTLLLTAAWPARGLGTAGFVLVDGAPVAIGGQTTVVQVANARDLAPLTGARLDVAGDVIVPGGGIPGTIEVGSTVAPLDLILHDGSVVATRRGADRFEALARTTASIPHEVRVEGSGPVVSLVRKGSDGERESFRGDRSGRTVAEFITREPVDGSLRRSSALAEGQKAVALTFDDGPSRFTTDILAVLAEKGTAATFFWVGKVAAGRSDMIRLARDAGHEVENHSWSHADLTALNAEGIHTEISRAAEALGGTRFLRPPYGKYNSTVVEQAGTLGQSLVLWDVDTLDWKIHDASSILSRVQAAVRPGAVILMHDGGGDRSQTVAALPAVVDWLLNEGYALTTLQHLAD